MDELTIAALCGGKNAKRLLRERRISERCEKCGVALTEADFVPCNLDTEDCPLLRMFNESLAEVIKGRRRPRDA